MKRILCLIAVFIIIASTAACGGSKEPESAEFTTENGTKFTAYTKATIHQLTIVRSAVEKLAPEADMSKVSTNRCTVEIFENGLHHVVFSPVIIDGKEKQGDCYFELDPDNEDHYYMHFLTIGSTTYLDDGYDLNAIYGDEE